jgi:hypothetical protein
LGVPPVRPIVYLATSPSCPGGQVLIDKDAYTELTRSDTLHDARTHAALIAKLADPNFGTFDQPVTMADIRELDEAA